MTKKEIQEIIEEYLKENLEIEIETWGLHLEVKLMLNSNVIRLISSSKIELKELE